MYRTEFRKLSESVPLCSVYTNLCEPLRGTVYRRPVVGPSKGGTVEESGSHRSPGPSTVGTDLRLQRRSPQSHDPFLISGLSRGVGGEEVGEDRIRGVLWHLWVLVPRNPRGSYWDHPSSVGPVGSLGPRLDAERLKVPY